MTVHRITEAAHVDLPGTQGVAEFVQVDTNLGIVACTTSGAQWTFTPVHVTSSTVSAGTAWTPTAAPHALHTQEFVALSGGRAVYLRTWTDGLGGEWSELFVLTTDGSTITVDSDTNLNDDLSIPGLAGLVHKTAAAAALFQVDRTTNPGPVTTVTYYRVDVSVGSIILSAAVGRGGDIFVHDDYTVGLFGSLVAFDGTGAVISTVSPGAGPTYLPFTSNTGALIGSTTYALVTLDPLSVDATGSSVFGFPNLVDGPSGKVGVDFPQITGAPAGEAWYLWFDYWSSSFSFIPPGDEPWIAAGYIPDVSAFGFSPSVSGWENPNFEPVHSTSYVDGTLGDYIDHVTQRFWLQGVGANTVVVAYSHGSTTTTVAVFATTTIAPPTAHLTVTPSTGAGPLTVLADATASTTPSPIPLVAAGWDMGDGSIFSPAGGLTKGHTYTPAITSTFTVTVTVYDFFQQSGSASATVHVTVTPKVLPPLRQYPRDDAQGGAPRQGTANGPTSLQASARQGWKNTYR